MRGRQAGGQAGIGDSKVLRSTAVLALAQLHSACHGACLRQSPRQSLTPGIAELMVFHPVDTVAKRLMSNRGSVSLGNLNQVIFKQAANAGIGGKFLSLFPGLGYAAGYKVAQRVYKFGGQPYFRDLIDKNAGSWFRTTFGSKTGNMLMHATAGS